MAQILVRNLEPQVVERLKQRARGNGRSLQAEASQILRDAAQPSVLTDARVIADKWHAHFQGRTFSDGAELIREDRER